MESLGINSGFSVQEILEKCIGCKWTMHVLTQIRHGVCRPGQLERTAEGLTTKVLNERLNKLTHLGIINRESFPEIPPRVEYRLTEFGQEFVQIFDQLETLQQRFSKKKMHERIALALCQPLQTHSLSARQNVLRLLCV